MKTNRIALAGAIACMALAACTRDPLQGPVAPGTEMVFTATLSEGPGTKTVLQDDGATVYWTKDEDIKVFFGNSMSGQFHSTNADASLTATFSGSLSGNPGSGTDYWALYPYDPEAVCDGSSVTMTIPAAQQGVAGTFADKMFPLLARSSDRNLAFYNVCGGARFSVTEEGITSATFRSVGGEALAGQVKVGMDSDGKPVVQEILDGVSEVTVTAPEGGFVVGQDYFAVLLPGTYGRGISLTLAGGTGSTTWSLAREMTIHRSKFGQLDRVDNGIWDETHKYFTITSQADGNTISFTKLTNENVPTIVGTFSYSLDQGATWISIGAWEDLASFSHTLNNGETLSLKGDLDKTCFGYRITIPEAATVSGNIMSLVSGDGFAGATELDSNYAFPELFFQSAVTDASELVLPAITLTQSCYSGMFLSCTALTAAPAVLPASTLADYCYNQMFLYCGNLTIAPELPATTLATNCYFGMFNGCTSLTIAPELPATALASSCYATMFSGCSSLMSSPELPATTLANSCYMSMFWGCTSLTIAPELPATTLASRCYESMFKGCTSLASTPELPATTLADYCYSNMFKGCTSLASTPELPAATLADNCYDSMFSGCTSLASTPELPAITLKGYCYREMFSGCTSLTSAPELPATTLASSCYREMFKGCSSLTNAPELPATTMALICYRSMFEGCTSLTSAPELPATSLVYFCYESMFKGCTSLSYVKALFTTTPSDDYTKDWLAGVAETGTFVKSTDATWNVVGPNGVPEGWVGGSERVVEVPDDLVYAYRLDENTVHDAFGDRTAEFMIPAISPGELLIRDFDRFLMSYMHMDPGQELRLFALDEKRTVEGQDYRRALIESPVPYFFLCFLIKEGPDDYSVLEIIPFHGEDFDDSEKKAEVLLDENGHLMLHVSIIYSDEEFMVCPMTCTDMITRETLSDEKLEQCLDSLLIEEYQAGIITIKERFTTYYEVEEPELVFYSLYD